MCGWRKEENFIQQQIFGLDFDGTITFEEFKIRSEMLEIRPVFVYKTLNYCEEDKRFRVVYINDCTIEKCEHAKLVLRLLLHLFPEADKQCADVARFFLVGKGLLEYNENAAINVMDLALAVQAFIKQKDPKNYIRKMSQVENRTGVKCIDGILRILKYKKSEENEINPNCILIGTNSNSSVSYYYEKKETPNEYVSSLRKEIKVIQNKSAKEIAACCPLFRDFYSNNLNHGLEFLLATNLLHVNGGKELFFSGLSDHFERWEAAWNTIKINYYKPMSCTSGECPYAEKCKCYSLYDKLQQRIVLKEQKDYISLEEGEQYLKAFVTEAINSEEKDLFLIKAQTSIGKTYTYTQMLKESMESEKPVLITVPTNKLQNEIYTTLRNQNVQVIQTVNKKEIMGKLGLIDMLQETNELYEKGFGIQVNKKISNYLKNENLHPGIKEMLEEVLNTKDKLNGACHVVTTHAMLLELPKIVLDQYEIIVDEDIWMTIFKATDTISFTDLKKALKSKTLSNINKSRINQILMEEHDMIGNSKPRPMSDYELEVFFREGNLIDGSLSMRHIMSLLKTSKFFRIPLPKTKLASV